MKVTLESGTDVRLKVVEDENGVDIQATTPDDTWAVMRFEIRGGKMVGVAHGGIEDAHIQTDEDGTIVVDTD